MIKSADYFYSMLLFWLSSLCCCDWATLQNGSMSIPPNIYKMNLRKNQTVYIGLQWNGNSILSIYGFVQGANVLNLTQCEFNLTAQRSSSKFAEVTAYVTATFYIRVVPVNLNIALGNLLPYTITFEFQLYYMIYKGTFHQKYLSSVIVSISDSSLLSNTRLRLTASNSSVVKNVFLFSESQPSINISSNKQICISNPTSQDTWIIFQINLTVAYNLLAINYTLQKIINSNCTYSCLDNIVTNLYCPPTPPPTISDPQPQPPTNLVAIISAVVGSVLFVVIMIVGIILYRRYKKKKQQERERQRQQNNSKPHLQNSGQNLQRESINQLHCSICLNANCNSSLTCKHNFHRVCIEQWLMRNKNCPVCRFEILRQEVFQ